ncbi:glycosyltransferase family 2 protein [Seohaeicola nanhaiensis]|uniref:Glycosyltransferase family 2 protein n=1 Tax=Seohaeicola nanhaiensis TaxID=1387282 RepID=A0ABV9KHN4_9RHOB
MVAHACVAQGMLGTLNLLAGFSRPARGAEKCRRRERPLRFSVHIATHEEPPAMVVATLRSLAAQVRAPQFEVIVLDNNTSDPSLWRPLEQACLDLGPHFRFLHVDGIKGAKAGALNIALKMTDPLATHVVIVDADYQVTPDFLATAATELQHCDDDFLQFPQAYRNDSGSAAGLSLELADYFLRHAREADHVGAMLLTGTLSVISRDALEATGGWSGATITEDAELGLRLRRLGFKGRFVDRTVGRGLLPLDFAGLSIQRYRWTAGNADTVRSGMKGLPLRTAIQIFAQLTAWSNMALPLAAGLIGGALSLHLGGETDQAALLTALSGFGMLMVLLSVCLPMLIGTIIRRRPAFPVILGALAARIAMIVPSAVATVDAVMGHPGGFRRTSKDVGGASNAIGWLSPALAMAGVALLWNAAALPWLGVAGAVLLLLPFPVAVITSASLASYRSSVSTMKDIRT